MREEGPAAALMLSARLLTCLPAHSCITAVHACGTTAKAMQELSRCKSVASLPRTREWDVAKMAIWRLCSIDELGNVCPGALPYTMAMMSDMPALVTLPPDLAGQTWRVNSLGCSVKGS